MCSQELLISISALACSMAQGKSVEEIGFLSAFFSQLSVSLATIAAQEACCLAAKGEKTVDEPFL